MSVRRAWLAPAAYLTATAFALAAAEHVVGLVAPRLAIFDTPLRHASFVVLNLTCAVGFTARGHAVAHGRKELSRPERAFPYVFALLVLQQLESHGWDAWLAHQEGRLDLASIAVVLFMPFAFALLVLSPGRARGEQ